MPRWLKVIIELAITYLKKTGQIDPNVQKKPDLIHVDETRTPDDVRGDSIRNRH